MKQLSNYVTSMEINNDMLTESLITETFISKFAKWLGGNAGKIAAKYKNIVGDLKNFNKDVATGYQGMLATSLDDRNKTVSKEEREKVLAAVGDDTKKSYIALKELIEKHKDNKDSLKEPFFVWAVLTCKKGAEAANDKEVLDFINPIWDSISDKDKTEANAAKKEATGESGNKEQTSGDNNGEGEGNTNNGGEENTNNGGEGKSVSKGDKVEGEKIEQEDADPIKSLAKLAKIEKGELDLAINDVLLDNEKSIYDLNDTNEVSIALAAIICGAYLLKNEDQRKNICNAIGVDYDTLNKKVMTVK